MVHMCTRAVLFQLSRLYGLTNSQQLLSGRELGGGEKMASEDEKAEAQETFNFFDKDRDGKISLDELKNMVMLLSGETATEEGINEMLKNVDLNGDGEIDFEEFYAAMKKDSITVTEELEEAFKVFDKDNDGFISPEELRSTMESMGETVSKEEIDAMIEKADLNGDGKISICEFVKIYSD